MNRVLVVEDCFIQLSTIETAIKKQYPNWQVDTASNYNDALKLIAESIIDKNVYSLFLFDIQLSDNSDNRDGYKLAEHLRTYKEYYKTPLIFLTIIPDTNYYALSAYHCYGYIPKPYTMETLLSYIQQLIITEYIHQGIKILDTKRFIHWIHLEEIFYIESQHHLLHIYIKDFVVKTRKYTINSIMPLLDHNFIHCHKSYIINKQFVNEPIVINGKILVNNIPIPVSRRYLKETKILLSEKTL